MTAAPYPISGTVTNAIGTPANNATVVLLNVDGESTQSTKTDSNGQYEFTLTDYNNNDYCHMIVRASTPEQQAMATFTLDTAAGSQEQDFTLERINTWAENKNIEFRTILNKVYDPIENRLRTEDNIRDLTSASDSVEAIQDTHDDLKASVFVNDGIVNQRKVSVSPNRAMVTAEVTRLIGTSFDNTTKDTNFWTETVTGSGSVTKNGEAELETGSTGDSTVKYTTVRKGRFIPATAMEVKTTAEFYTAATANNKRSIGAYDTNNGFFFLLDGTTFKIVTRTNTSGSPVDTEVASGSFNGDSSTYVMNTSPHNMLITTSMKSVFFIIDGKLIHQATFTHSTRPKTFTLPITIENNNSGGLDTDIAFHIVGASLYRIGKENTAPTSKFIQGQTAATICKYGAGNICTLVVSAVENNSAITIYDNTAASGTIIWDSGAMGAQTQPFSLDLCRLPFAIGLTVKIVTADSDILLVYE